MINFITRYFTSLWAFITFPFRAVWRVIVRVFPPREFTVMDTPRGNVYTYSQSSFWRFTRFCAKIGLALWASWSTYVFVYHRPLLQKRTEQLEMARATHTRHMSDLQTYLTKYNNWNQYKSPTMVILKFRHHLEGGKVKSYILVVG